MTFENRAMGRNNQTNSLIMWGVIVGDFVLLNVLLYVFGKLDIRLAEWSWERMRMFVLISNFALVIAEVYFHTTIQQRLVSAGDVVRNVMMLTITQALITYMVMRHLLYMVRTGELLFEIGTAFFLLLMIIRLLERIFIKRMRRIGRNTRTVTFLGNDPELQSVYEQLLNDPTAGYRMLGYYADEKIEKGRREW